LKIAPYFVACLVLFCQNAISQNLTSNVSTSIQQIITAPKKTNRFIIELRNTIPTAKYANRQSIKSTQKDRESHINQFVTNVSGKIGHIKIIAQLSRSRTAFVTHLTPIQHSALSKTTDVERIYPSYDLEPNVTTGISQIKADQVWDLAGKDSIQGAGVKIAVFDTGIDYTHPDLGGCFGEACKVQGGYDFYNDDAKPIDDNGHGTHVAGIIAANGLLRGVAPEASLFAYKVCSSQGICPDYIIIKAFEAAMDPDGDPATDDRVDIINVSLGSPEGEGTPDHILAQTLNQAVDAGILVVVSAGNEGEYNILHIGSLGSAEKGLTVAASDGLFGIAAFSTRGYIRQNGHAKPEISAPGVLINSTTLNQAYDKYSGTSMAAPFVSGAAALLLSQNSDYSVDELRSSLVSTTTDLGLGLHEQGTGVVDVLAATQAEIRVDTSVINFGWFNKLEQLNQTKRIVLRNPGKSVKQVSLSIRKNSTNTTTFTPSQSEVTLLVGESVNIDIAVLFPQSIEPLPVENPAYIAWLDIKTNEKTQSIPMVFLHTKIIKVYFSGFP
jgi:subtilisin family serine protease